MFYIHFSRFILLFSSGKVELIIDFLQPPFEALIHEEELFKKWNHEKKEYE